MTEPVGDMATAAWEGYATQVASAEQEGLLSALKAIVAINMSQKENIFMGKNSRGNSSQ